MSPARPMSAEHVLVVSMVPPRSPCQPGRSGAFGNASVYAFNGNIFMGDFTGATLNPGDHLSLSDGPHPGHHRQALRHTGISLPAHPMPWL